MFLEFKSFIVDLLIFIILVIEHLFKIENVDVEPLIPVNDIQDEMGTTIETSNEVECNDVTNFICDICNHQYTRKSYLQRHMNYMHRKRKKKKIHQCLICHKMLFHSIVSIIKLFNVIEIAFFEFQISIH